MRKHRKIINILVVFIFLFNISFPGIAATFSGHWYKKDNEWRVEGQDGDVTNALVCDDDIEGNDQDIWYLIDAKGNLVTSGLVQDKEGNYYSIETDHKGYYGMLRNKSGEYEGIYLELEESVDNNFASIKNQDGINKLKAKYGVSIVDIDNAEIVYTSQIGSQNSASGQSSGKRGISTGQRLVIAVTCMGILAPIVQRMLDNI